MTTSDMKVLAKDWLEARDAQFLAEETAHRHALGLVACRQRVLDAVFALGAGVFAGVELGDGVCVERAVQSHDGVVTVRHLGAGSSVPYTVAFVPFAG